MQTCAGLVDSGEKTPVRPVCTRLWGQKRDREMEGETGREHCPGLRTDRSPLKGPRGGYHIWGLLFEPVTADFSTNIPNFQINYLLTRDSAWLCQTETVGGVGWPTRAGTATVCERAPPRPHAHLCGRGELLASLKGHCYLCIFFLYQGLEIKMEGCAGPKTSPSELFFWLTSVLASNRNPGENCIVWFWCVGLEIRGERAGLLVGQRQEGARPSL